MTNTGHIYIRSFTIPANASDENYHMNTALRVTRSNFAIRHNDKILNPIPLYSLFLSLAL